MYHQVVLPICKEVWIMAFVGSVVAEKILGFIIMPPWLISIVMNINEISSYGVITITKANAGSSALVTLILSLKNGGIISFLFLRIKCTGASWVM